MKVAKWSRRAGWLAAVALMTVNFPSARADDAAAAPEAKDKPATEATPATPAAKEAPAAAPAPAAPAAAPRPPRPPRPPSGLSSVRRPKYRLDLELAPVGKALDQQLDLKGEGVVVERVTPDGPAAKAGIKENDILLAVGDKPIKAPNGLMDVLNGSDGKEMSIKLIRAGKPTTVTVTPRKGEDELSLESHKLDLKLDGLADIKDLRDIERQIREKLKDAGVDVRMQVIRPGHFMSQDAIYNLLVKRREFPEDLNVDIRKHGKEPAEIEVKRGDKSWKVKENELAQLPEDVREHVESLLGQHPMRFNVVAPPGRPHRPGDEVGPPHDGPGHPDGPPPGGPPERRGGPGRRGPDGPPPPGDHDHEEVGPGGPRPPGPPGERGPRARRPGRPDGPGPGGPEERGPRGRGGLERRLEELSRDLNRMRDQLDGLREGLREEERDE